MKKQPEYQKVITYLKEEILADRLAPKQRLPAERELSAQLGVGRYSVREGLRVLENWGLIQSRPGSGSYLTGDPCRSMPNALHFLLLSRQVTHPQIGQVRRALEQEACRSAMQDMTPSQSAELSRLLDQMKTADAAQAAAMDYTFHQMIFRYAANPLLTQLMDALSLVCQAQIQALWQNAGQETRSLLLAVHQEILDSMLCRDAPRCRRAMDHHYETMEQLHAFSPDSVSTNSIQAE